MLELIVVSDTHLGAPHAVKGIDFEDLLTLKLDNPNAIVVLTGDIIDMANCKAKDAELWRRRIEQLISLYGTNYIPGNHECMHPRFGYHQVIEVNGKKVLFTHGHYRLYYPQSDVVRWEEKGQEGRGTISRAWYSLYRGTIRAHHGGWKVPGEDIQLQAFKYMDEFGADMIVYGHTHNEYDGLYSGKRIVNVNKGITKVIV